MLAALLLVLMGALGFYIAYWISSTGLAYWRAVAGFAVAFIVSWVGGVGMSALVFAVTGTVNIGAATTSLLGKLFWWALICSGYGVYKGRAKFGPKAEVDSVKLKNDAQPSVRATVGNDFYAEAMAEIEEGRLDKGAWARAFSEAGGEDAKARALYIRARAGALRGAEVWEDTQPPESSESGIKAKVEKGTVKLDNPAPVSTPKWPIWIVAGALPVYILVSLAVSAFRAIPSGQIEAEATTGSQPMTQDSPDKGKGEIALPARPSPELDLSEFSAENQKRLKEQEKNRRVDVDSMGWTQDNTGSSEVGPWLDYSPPGTRYCRYPDRTIVRVYPPGVKPSAEKANPFCVDTSTEVVPK